MTNSEFEGMQEGTAFAAYPREPGAAIDTSNDTGIVVQAGGIGVGFWSYWELAHRELSQKQGRG